MMENAASSLAQIVLSKKTDQISKCIILCGKGNNGGDGYALTRLLKNNLQTFLYKIEEPVTAEAIAQHQMCTKIGIPVLTKQQLLSELNSNEPKIIVDCIYGTGFRGELPQEIIQLFNIINTSTVAVKIACDVPSGLHKDGTAEPESFIAEYTVSMGEQKLAFYSDAGKTLCGKIIVADLGIASELFQSQLPPSACLIEKNDAQLPYRTNKAAHKGTYGHTAVFTGAKSGAAVIAATAAMNFGSGLTTLVETKDSNLSQFKISPELMLSKTIPKKTTAIVLGPGIDNFTQQDFTAIREWINSNKKSGKSCGLVFDAGMFSQNDFVSQLFEYSKDENLNIVLTPHLLELSRFYSLLKTELQNKQINMGTDLNLPEEFTVTQLANQPDAKIQLGKILNDFFPNVTVVMKSANTFICDRGQTFIINDGTQNLAKGGSGDILAGMIGSLLAQGYTNKNAAITACETHAIAANEYGESAFDLTPGKLISKL